MTMLDKSGSSFAVNGLNAIIRILQIAFAAIVLGIFAEARSHDQWKVYTYFGKHYTNQFSLAIAAGVLSIITGLLFGLIPFLVSYYYVAIGCIWDWIIFFIWTAVFTINRRTFSDENTNEMTWIRKSELPSIDALKIGVWFALGAMLITLASAIMGPVCLWLDRRSLRGSRARV